MVLFCLKNRSLGQLLLCLGGLGSVLNGAPEPVCMCVCVRVSVCVCTCVRVSVLVSGFVSVSVPAYGLFLYQLPRMLTHTIGASDAKRETQFH